MKGCSDGLRLIREDQIGLVNCLMDSGRFDGLH